MPPHARPLPRYGPTEYEIDFKSMMQINLSTGAKRCVRRVQYQSVAKTESQIDEHQTQSADKTESQSAASTVQASSSGGAAETESQIDKVDTGTDAP